MEGGPKYMLSHNIYISAFELYIYTILDLRALNMPILVDFGALEIYIYPILSDLRALEIIYIYIYIYIYTYIYI